MEKSKLNTSGDFGINGHVIICNWSNKADIIVRQLHDISVKNKNPIIVITEKPEKIPKTADPAYRGLLIIGGDPADKEILERADVKNARTVIVLADEESLEKADSKAILIVLAIDAINPNVHVIVELLSSKSEMYFQYTHANEIICLEQLAEKLLAQSALTPGLSQVYMDLLTQSADTNEIYQEEIPEFFIGKTYREIEAAIIAIDEKDIILIGFASAHEKRKNNQKILNHTGRTIQEIKVTINPRSSSNGNFSKNHQFKQGDSIFLISYEKPEIAQYFKKKELK
ncbi:MAG: hypothetical protein DWQ05_22235 [Calditrichaeota bacterium]|nr:MAG: hypothetical protein DWQ05_22235 [Calditrichota bacterium]